MPSYWVKWIWGVPVTDSTVEKYIRENNIELRPGEKLDDAYVYTIEHLRIATKFRLLFGELVIDVSDGSVQRVLVFHVNRKGTTFQEKDVENIKEKLGIPEVEGKWYRYHQSFNPDMLDRYVPPPPPYAE